jgi:periplasmic copper chaperone A
MFRLPLAAVAALLAAPALACDGFEVHDAHARASTAMSQSGAAFMVIHNHGSADCHIASVRSDVAAATELHTHLTDSQGVMRMVQVTEGFPLPAGGEVLLQRGGNHVMFLGLIRPLAQGDEIAITFVFADGAEHEVLLPVDNERAPSGNAHGQAHGHGHGTRAP